MALSLSLMYGMLGNYWHTYTALYLFALPRRC